MLCAFGNNRAFVFGRPRILNKLFCCFFNGVGCNLGFLPCAVIAVCVWVGKKLLCQPYLPKGLQLGLSFGARLGRVGCADVAVCFARKRIDLVCANAKSNKSSTKRQIQSTKQPNRRKRHIRFVGVLRNAIGKQPRAHVS